jgi:hypothetical protein
MTHGPAIATVAWSLLIVLSLARVYLATPKGVGGKAILSLLRSKVTPTKRNKKGG